MLSLQRRHVISSDSSDGGKSSEDTSDAAVRDNNYFKSIKGLWELGKAKDKLLQFCETEVNPNEFALSK